MTASTVDHAVINVRNGLDQARHLYRRLGFDLTHRGHHSVGTSNYLAIFGRTYLELLGFVGDNACPPSDLVDAPVGLRALALGGGEPDKVAARWSTLGLLDGPPADLDRPVAHAAGIASARFRIFRLRADWIANARLFYCHHYTPELVWRDEWRHHANGVTELIGVDISSENPRNAASLYGQAFGMSQSGIDTTHIDAGPTRLSFIPARLVRRRYGYGGANALEQMVALRFATRSLFATREVLTCSHIPFCTLNERSVMVEARHAMGVALVFVA
ncbi:VOC family protein [Paraburkholderia unamae]|uniref:VOC family protein n=1 Tax=Paraburkholderia unamae TaxID=219649 RepID=UPI0015EB8D0F|nr:VOC family protein [Paraburkholderia unamae]